MRSILNTNFPTVANPIGTQGGIVFATLTGTNGVRVISSGVAEGTTITSANACIDTTNTYPNDQYCYAPTVGAWANAANLWLLLRVTQATSGARVTIQQGGASAVLAFYNGSSFGAAVYTWTLNTTAASADNYLFQVVGQVYTLYQNGASCGAYTDGSSTVTAGKAGFGFYTTGVLANSQISNFQAGAYTALLSVSAAATSYAASLSTSIGIQTHGGDAGIAFVQTVSAQPLATFADTAGNTWHGTATPVLNVTLNAVHYYIYLLWAQNIVGGTNQTYTATVSGGTAEITINVMFFPGRETSGGLFDGSISTYTDASAGTSHTGPSLVTGFAGSDIASLCVDAAQPAEIFTAGSGFTIATVNPGNGASYFPSMTQYQNSVSAGAYTAPWTTANTVVGAGIAVALLSVLSGGGGGGGAGNLSLLGFG